MNEVSQSIITPFMGVSFDNSRAASGPAEMPVNVGLLGQKTTAGTAVEGQVYLVSSTEQVMTLAGKDSHIYRIAKKWFANNRQTPCYILPLADGVGTASVRTIPITGTATEAGELPCYVDGERFSIPVAPGDTAASLITALVDTILTDTTLNVTPSSGSGLVFTAKNKGIAAGAIPVDFCIYAGERVPAGIVIGTQTFTAGTVDPVVNNALVGIKDLWINILIGPYTDTTNLTAIEKFYEDNANPEISKDGVYITAKNDTLSNLITFSTDTSRNCQYVVCVVATGMYESMGTVAAAVGAEIALSVTEDVAVPLHRIALDLIPAPTNNRFTLSERNQLAKAGLFTLTHNNGVQTDATVTMYLRNSAGAADTSYRKLNTIFIAMYCRYTFINRILTKYPQAKILMNADRVRGNQQILTEDTGKAEAIGWFMELEAKGILENLEQFKAETTCKRSLTNGDRMEWFLPTDFANQFIVGSGVIQFKN